MNANKRLLTAGAAVLGLGLVCLAGAFADENKEVKDAMNKVVDTAGKKPDELPKKAEAFAKDKKIDNDSIKDVMDLLGKPDEGGWGYKTAAGKTEDIEKRVRELSQNKPPVDKASLAKEADALVELANRTAAVGSVATVAAPKKAIAGKGTPKEWKDASEEMVKASQELAKAAAAKDPEAVKKAGNRLQGACSDCHSKFK